MINKNKQKTVVYISNMVSVDYSVETQMKHQIKFKHFNKGEQ